MNDISDRLAILIGILEHKKILSGKEVIMIYEGCIEDVENLKK